MYLHLTVYYIKDTEKQPDEETQGVKFGRVLSTEASVSMELGCSILAHGCARSSPNLTLFGMFYEGFVT